MSRKTVWDVECLSAHAHGDLSPAQETGEVRIGFGPEHSFLLFRPRVGTNRNEGSDAEFFAAQADGGVGATHHLPDLFVRIGAQQLFLLGGPGRMHGKVLWDAELRAMHLHRSKSAMEAFSQ